MKETSKIILGIVIIVLLGVIGVGGYFLVKNDNEANKKISELENKIGDMEKNIVTANVTSKNENKGSTTGIKKLQLDDVTIVKILMNTEDFENGQALTDEEYLAIAYNAINEEYIVIDKDRSPSAGKSEVEYTTDEINSIIYSLFGVNLTKFEDYGTVLRYKDGVYKFAFSDKGTTNYEAKRITDDVAAGTTYVSYDYYVSDEYGTKDMGSYAIAISNITGFVREKMKIDD